MLKSNNIEIYSDSRFALQSYREIADRVERACDWLVGYGLPISTTRIGQYRDCMLTLGEHYDNGTLDAVEKSVDFPKMVNSVWEAAELVRIHEGLSPVVSSDMGSKLRMFIKGAENRDPSIPDDPGRDVAFELSIAARFARAGFTVDFGTDADLRVPLPNNTIFVECKRPKSHDKVDRHVSGAVRQLNRRYASVSANESPKGIVAMSLGMVINPDAQLLVAATRDDLDAKVRFHTDKFIQRHQHRWMDRVAMDGYTLGVFMVLDLPTVIEDLHLLSTYHEFAVNNTCAVNAPDIDLLYGIVKRLRQS